jgi:hypothetical protein
MSERAQVLAGRLDQANNDLIAVLGGCTAEHWRQPCVDEDRPLGVVAHHVAGAHRAVAGWIRALVNGEPLPGLTHDDIDALNARQAARHTDPAQAETIQFVRTACAGASAFVAGLTDEQLARSGSMPLFGDHPLTADQVIRHVLIAHVTGHLESIQRTVAG